MHKRRHILHVDMDAFYASVEQRDDPSLRGQPVVVGGSGNRGVVAAASYEAREFGIRSAMPMRQALKRCPQVRRVRPRMAHYKSISDDIFEIFRQYTPQVEGLSLDEAFLDVTASLKLFGADEEIARRIKTQIREHTGLTASVGVAPSKLVAKIASDLDKPDGLVVVTPGGIAATLDPLAVQVIPGIGRETLAKLHARQIFTIADLRMAGDKELEPVFGRYTSRIRKRAAGVDDRPVVASRADKSISAEETYEKDLSSLPEMHRQLLRLSERTAGRLRAKSLVSGTVQIKIRESDFTTYTRQSALKPPTNSTREIFTKAKELLSEWLLDHPDARLRLLGVGGSDLAAAARQDDLFDSDERTQDSSLDKTVDAIRERFGNIPVGRARSLDDG